MVNNVSSKSSLSKKKIPLIIVIVCILASVSFAALMLKPPSLTDAERFSSEYLMIDEDNIFVYKNAKQTVEILADGTGIVFMGFPTCPWCQAYVALLQDVAKQMDIKEIYYLDIFNDRSKNSIEYQRLVEMKERHLLQDDDGRPRIYVPDVTIVKDGVFVGHDNQTSTIDDMDPSDYWTLPRAEALQERLREMIKLIQ
jgi:predicted bacteriocin transport accessory protein